MPEVKNGYEKRKRELEQEKQKGGKRPSWQKTFVDCNLSKEDKEAVKRTLENPDAVMERITQLFLDGYKVSMSYDATSDAFGCYVTMPDEGHPAHGSCLTARGPSLLGAFATLCYKHFVMLDGTWANPVDRGFEADQWA